MPGLCVFWFVVMALPCYAQAPSPPLIWTWYVAGECAHQLNNPIRISGTTTLNLAPSLGLRFQPSTSTYPAANSAGGTEQFAVGAFSASKDGQLWLAVPNTLVSSFNTTSQLWTWFAHHSLIRLCSKLTTLRFVWIFRQGGQFSSGLVAGSITVGSTLTNPGEGICLTRAAIETSFRTGSRGGNGVGTPAIAVDSAVGVVWWYGGAGSSPASSDLW
jgi:hypothetical protein